MPPTRRSDRAAKRKREDAEETSQPRKAFRDPDAASRRRGGRRRINVEDFDRKEDSVESRKPRNSRRAAISPGNGEDEQDSVDKESDPDEHNEIDELEGDQMTVDRNGQEGDEDDEEDGDTSTTNEESVLGMMPAPRRHARVRNLQQSSMNVGSKDAAESESSSRQSESEDGEPSEEPPLNVFEADKPFKAAGFRSGLKRFKSLKHILSHQQAKDAAAAEADEAIKQAQAQMTTWASIRAPPSIRSQRKYCDITGLPTTYTDPVTGLNYYNAEIYQHIKSLSSSTIQKYLQIRNKTVVI